MTHESLLQLESKASNVLLPNHAWSPRNWMIVCALLSHILDPIVDMWSLRTNCAFAETRVSCRVALCMAISEPSKAWSQGAPRHGDGRAEDAQLVLDFFSSSTSREARGPSEMFKPTGIRPHGHNMNPASTITLRPRESETGYIETIANFPVENRNTLAWVVPTKQASRGRHI